MWKTIKKIVQKNKGTCIIIEDGKPAFVITPFDDYQEELDGCGRKNFEGNFSEQELLEKINQDIVDWKSKQAISNPELDLSEQESEQEDESELKIENLPLM